MQFGGNIEHANKVSFYIPQATYSNLPDDFKEHYNSNMIKEIMCSICLDEEPHIGYRCISFWTIFIIEGKIKKSRVAYA